MPLVGKKHFSYTKAGYKAAALEAKRTGKPMTLSPNPSTKKTKTKAKKPKKKISRSYERQVDAYFG